MEAAEEERCESGMRIERSEDDVRVRAVRALACAWEIA